MEKLSVNTINSQTFSHSKQSEETRKKISTSIPNNEMVEHLNKIGNEYPFCVFHKHKNNDPL